MSAKDYAITFPYGATSAPYSPSHPHRGDDRPCPIGTPVVIDNITIGLTGATGRVTGAHLHIQEWQGSPSNTRKPQNSFKGGTVTTVAVSSDFGIYVTITKDGWNTSYCHLSGTNVQVGQEIGVDIVANNAQIDDWISKQHFIAFGIPASAETFNSWRPVLKNNFVDGSLSILAGIDTNGGALKNKPPSTGEYVPVTDQLYKKKG